MIREEKKRGYWASDEKDFTVGIVCCSACGAEFNVDDLENVGESEREDWLPNYCPHCGAKMFEEMKGHWTEECRCSVCDNQAILAWNETGGAWVMTPFCPWCGAEMDQKEEQA